VGARRTAAATAEESIRRTWVKQRREARSARVPRLLQEWAGAHLDISSHNIVVALAEGGPMRMTDLAHEVGSDLSTVSRQVAHSEALGLVRREPLPGSPRGSVLHLTRTGERVVAQLVTAWDRLLDPVLREWSDADLVAFEAGLTRFTVALRGEIERHLEGARA